MRSVPEHIATPWYAVSGGEPAGSDEPLVKSPEVIERMRRAGRLAASVLESVGAAVAPSVTTDALDDLAHSLIVSAGAYPSPLNYHGYPKSICTSVNEVICHGIPDDRPLEDGDIVNIDVTVFMDGVHGDTDAMFLVGSVDAGSRRLVEVTRSCLEAGIEAVRPGRPVSDIGRAIEGAAGPGFGVVRSFVGHAIGEQFHGGLQIPHYYEPSASTVMQPGMTFTIEPMITAGDWRHVLWDDGWTAVTRDGSRAAQFEHTLVVTDDGAEVLTLCDG